MEMMCFVVISTTDSRCVYQGMQIDDGDAAYAFAKEKGCHIRKWEMYGLSHFHELDIATKKEIKAFCRELKNYYGE